MKITKKELEQAKYWKRELKMWEDRKYELLSVEPSSQRLTGMPFANTNENHSPTEEKAIEAIEKMGMYDEKIKELENQIFEVEKFIISLGDSLIRQIIELRCIGDRSWVEISKYLGDGYTPEGVRKTYSRFMRRLK